MISASNSRSTPRTFVFQCVPVLLGIGFLRERLRGGQVAGLVASVAASILIATA